MLPLGAPYKTETLTSLLGGDRQGKNLEISHIAYDTRQLYPVEGVLFWALRGVRDGHAYLSDAYEKGACAAVVEAFTELPLCQIRVANTWKALHQWAFYHRQRLTYPIVGITGSYGKTLVKEWASYLWGKGAYKSPGSFNSQLGVPLSILGAPLQAEIGFFEAGIAAPYDMDPLAALLRPHYGVLTSLGAAHQENFRSVEEKLAEKLKLFHHAQWVIAPAQPFLQAHQELYRGKWLWVGKDEIVDYRILRQEVNAADVEVVFEGSQIYRCYFPFSEPWLIQDAVLAMGVVYFLGGSVERASQLEPLRLRQEWISDRPGQILLNDTYFSDVESLRQTLHFYARMPTSLPKKAIVSDFSPYDAQAHQEMTQLMESLLGPEQVFRIGPLFSACQGKSRSYASVESFLEEVGLHTWEPAYILLKGGRRFRLEEVIPYLTQHDPSSYLEVRLHRMAENLLTLRRFLPASTEIMPMLKAEAYGSGSRTIAAFLVRQGIKVLGVASGVEALRLRSSGLTQTIVVFSPGLRGGSLFAHKGFEVVVGSWPELEYWAGKVPLHIEVDTGMGRRGFRVEEVPQLLAYLKDTQGVKALVSHLAAADNSAHDALTRHQLHTFSQVEKAFRTLFPDIKTHVLNTAGVLRWGWYGGSWARVGIGLYTGLPPLKEVTRFQAQILRIALYPAGATVGYGVEVLQRPSRIATVGVGYADGIFRNLSDGKGYFVVKGREAPIVGRVNMDMTVIDVTHIPDAHVGDWVEIWGDHLSLAEYAQRASTIPYEVLTHVADRIRRIYTWEP
ncbi:MAG: alanine racemase [Bacteroidia bacterium]